MSVFPTARESRAVSVNQLKTLQEIRTIEESILGARLLGQFETVVNTSQMTNPSVSPWQDFHTQQTLDGSIPQLTVNTEFLALGDDLTINGVTVDVAPNVFGTVQNPIITNGKDLKVNGVSVNFRPWILGTVLNPTVIPLSRISLDGVTIAFQPIAASTGLPAVTIGHSLVIDGFEVVATGTTAASFVTDVNTAAIPCVTASINEGIFYIRKNRSLPLQVSAGTGTLFADFGWTSTVVSTGSTLQDVVDNINSAIISDVTAFNDAGKLLIGQFSPGPLTLGAAADTVYAALGITPNVYLGSTQAEILQSFKYATVPNATFAFQAGHLHLQSTNTLPLVVEDGLVNSALLEFGLESRVYTGKTLAELVSLIDFTYPTVDASSVLIVGGVALRLQFSDNITVSGTVLPKVGIIAGTYGTLDLSTDTITLTSHGLVSEQAVELRTAGTLPLSLLSGPGTYYYVIVVDANRIKLALTPTAAHLGTAVDITTSGTGVHSVRPASEPAKFFAVWQDTIVDRAFDARMNSVIEYFQSQEYTIFRRAVSSTFEWVVRW